MVKLTLADAQAGDAPDDTASNASAKKKSVYTFTLASRADLESLKSAVNRHWESHKNIPSSSPAPSRPPPSKKLPSDAPPSHSQSCTSIFVKSSTMGLNEKRLYATSPVSVLPFQFSKSAITRHK